MFSTAKCRICGDAVRFALRHLRVKHPETLEDNDVAKLRMSKIMRKYFT
jgi:hypothetical protein